MGIRTQMGSDSYSYDNNGNQVTRYVSGSSYTLSYDAENRLAGRRRARHRRSARQVTVSVTGAASATFVYDGDGNRVKATVGTATTTYVGSYFEWTGSTSTMKKYYYAGSTRVAMRTGSSTINYLLGDHLGSQAITTNSSGVKSAEVRYYPWGNTRYTSGTTPTTFKFTGQRFESGIGLYFYNARWYDSSAGRFIQADSIVPGAGNPQAYDRYAYVLNNPLRYTDPSGHDKLNSTCGPDGIFCDQYGNLLSNEELYDYLIEEGSFVPLPEPYEIYDPDYNNYNRINAVLQNYENARKLIFLEYGWSSIGRYLENNGKLTDKVFMAMLAAGEFASETGEAFLESIEALSNQYYSQKSIYGPMQCFGSCDFITQILWATQMAAWFSNNFINQVITSDLWLGQYDFAQMAIDEYYKGADTSWFWGNVSWEECNNYALTITPVYRGTPADKPYFIVYAYQIFK